MKFRLNKLLEIKKKIKDKQKEKIYKGENSI